MQKIRCVGEFFEDVYLGPVIIGQMVLTLLLQQILRYKRKRNCGKNQMLQRIPHRRLLGYQLPVCEIPSNTVELLHPLEA